MSKLSTMKKEKENKTFTTAPLPFMGQKRKFLKPFKAALKKYPANGTYVDLFGGSGLLAHTVKKYFPDAKVIYNDYDNYRERIEAIEQTNELIAKLKVLVGDCPKDKRIPENIKKKVLQAVKLHEEEYGYVDYITLSSSLLFSMKYVLNYEDLAKGTLYNCIRLNAYNSDGYLDGLEIVQDDYKVLFDRYQNERDVVFLIDPPYLQTQSTTYKNYWSLSDYLDVLTILDGQSYFYFTSNKSSIIELCDWVGSRSLTSNPFADAERAEMNATMNYNASYTDIMLFK